MRATLYGGPGDITVGERPDPRLENPTDAIVRVTMGCVCGSDLWYYRGVNPHALGPIGHEFIGVVEDTGSDVTTVRKGDLVVAPFAYSDGTCEHCRAGLQTSCVHGGFWATGDVDGGQGEAVRVPLGNITLTGGPAPARAYIAELLPDVLDGKIEPGKVFDRTVDLDGVPDGYRAMDAREALKVLVKP